MQETAEQYTNRLIDYLKKDDPLRIMRATIRKLDQYMKKAGRRATKPVKGRWNIAALLAHFAEAELAYSYRIRMIVSANGCPIQAYDQNIWVENAKYLRKNPKMAFDLFRSLRVSNIAFVKSLTKEQLERFGIHSERGKESVWHLTRLIAGHDRNHMWQIEDLLG